MVVAGDAFKARVSPYHVFIVITPPDENDEAVVVNLTSLKSEEEDQACVLHPADYPDFIRAVNATRVRRKPCKTSRSGKSGRNSLARRCFDRGKRRHLMPTPRQTEVLTRKPSTP